MSLTRGRRGCPHYMFERRRKRSLIFEFGIPDSAYILLKPRSHGNLKAAMLSWLMGGP